MSEEGIFCDKKVPGDSEADVFKHNLTWEHRSKVDSLSDKPQQTTATTSTEGTPSSSSSSVTETITVASTTTPEYLSLTTTQPIVKPYRVIHRYPHSLIPPPPPSTPPPLTMYPHHRPPPPNNHLWQNCPPSIFGSPPPPNLPRPRLYSGWPPAHTHSPILPYNPYRRLEPFIRPPQNLTTTSNANITTSISRGTPSPVTESQFLAGKLSPITQSPPTQPTQSPPTQPTQSPHTQSPHTQSHNTQNTSYIPISIPNIPNTNKGPPSNEATTSHASKVNKNGPKEVAAIESDIIKLSPSPTSETLRSETLRSETLRSETIVTKDTTMSVSDIDELLETDVILSSAVPGKGKRPPMKRIPKLSETAKRVKQGQVRDWRIGPPIRSPATQIISMPCSNRRNDKPYQTVGDKKRVPSFSASSGNSIARPSHIHNATEDNSPVKTNVPKTPQSSSVQPQSTLSTTTATTVSATTTSAESESIKSANNSMSKSSTQKSSKATDSCPATGDVSLKEKKKGKKGKQPKQPKELKISKKKKNRNKSGINDCLYNKFKKVVVRDNSPKFVPPEKAKKKRLKKMPPSSVEIVSQKQKEEETHHDSSDSMTFVRNLLRSAPSRARKFSSSSMECEPTLSSCYDQSSLLEQSSSSHSVPTPAVQESHPPSCTTTQMGPLSHKDSTVTRPLSRKPSTKAKVKPEYDDSKRKNIRSGYGVCHSSDSASGNTSETALKMPPCKADGETLLFGDVAIIEEHIDTSDTEDYDNCWKSFKFEEKAKISGEVLDENFTSNSEKLTTEKISEVCDQGSNSSSQDQIEIAQILLERMKKTLKGQSKRNSTASYLSQEDTLSPVDGAASSHRVSGGRRVSQSSMSINTTESSPPTHWAPVSDVHDSTVTNNRGNDVVSGSHKKMPSSATTSGYKGKGTVSSLTESGSSSQIVESQQTICHHLKLPLLSPKTVFKSLNSKHTTSEATPSINPPLASTVSDPATTAFLLNKSLQSVQKKLDFETTQLKLIKLLKVPSSSQHTLEKTPPLLSRHVPSDTATTCPVPSDPPALCKTPKRNTPSLSGQPKQTPSLSSYPLEYTSPQQPHNSPLSEVKSKARRLSLTLSPKTPDNPTLENTSQQKSVQLTNNSNIHVPSANEQVPQTKVAPVADECSSDVDSIVAAESSPFQRKEIRSKSPKLDIIISSLRFKKSSSGRRPEGSADHSGRGPDETTDHSDRRPEVDRDHSGRGPEDHSGSSRQTEDVGKDMCTSSDMSTDGNGGLKKRKRKKSTNDDNIETKKLRVVLKDSARARTRVAEEQPTPSFKQDKEGTECSNRESEPENMSVSSSQNSSSREDVNEELTPHMKFALDIAALDKKDKELQDKLYAAQNEVVTTSQCVQESERRLKELIQRQRQLEEQRVELTEEYKKILVEKQNLFSSPTENLDGNDGGHMPDLNFFERMKVLSEKEQDMQVKLLQRNQLLENVNIQKNKEEKELMRMKNEKLNVAQNQLSTLMRDYKEVQGQKQELLMSSWRTTLPTSPANVSSIGEPIVPLQSTSNQAVVATNVLVADSSRVSSASATGSDVMTFASSSSAIPDLQLTPELMESPKTISENPSPPSDHSAYTQHQSHLLGNLPKSPLELTPSSELIMSSLRIMLTPLRQEQSTHSQSQPKTSSPRPILHSLLQCNSEQATTSVMSRATSSSVVCDSATTMTSVSNEEMPILNTKCKTDSVGESIRSQTAMATGAETTVASGAKTTVASDAETTVASDAKTTVASDAKTAVASGTKTTVASGTKTTVIVDDESTMDITVTSDSESETCDGIRQAWIAAQALSYTTTATPQHTCIGGGSSSNNSDISIDICGGIDDDKGKEGSIEKDGVHKQDELNVVEYSPQHDNCVLGVKVSGGHLYSCSSDKSVKAYDIKSGKQVKEYCKHKRSITCIEVFNYGCETYIVSGASDKHIIMCDAKTGDIEIDFNLGARVQCMQSQGHLLVAGLSNGFVHLINLQTKCALGRWLVGETANRRDVSTVSIHQNILFTACYDDKITCWDISDYSRVPLTNTSPLTSAVMRKLHQISSFKMFILCMQVEGELLYCGSADTTLQIFNIKTWEKHNDVRGHNGAVSGLFVNGNLLITSCFDHLIRCFDTKDMTLLQMYNIQDLPFTLYSARDTVYCGLRNGKVISVKIDLSHYHQCQWAMCGLKFGIKDHLRLHLKDHLLSAGDIPVQCKWSGCNHSVTIVSQHVNNHLNSLS